MEQFHPLQPALAEASRRLGVFQDCIEGGGLTAQRDPVLASRGHSLLAEVAELRARIYGTIPTAPGPPSAPPGN